MPITGIPVTVGCRCYPAFNLFLNVSCKTRDRLRPDSITSSSSHLGILTVRLTAQLLYIENFIDREYNHESRIVYSSYNIFWILQMLLILFICNPRFLIYIRNFIYASIFGFIIVLILL